jgi:hypothetical protein
MSTPEGTEVLDAYFSASPRAAIDRVKYPDWDEPGMSTSAWSGKLIDRLEPYGGIRIEDNLYITEEGTRNITREYLP